MPLTHWDVPFNILISTEASILVIFVAGPKMKSDSGFNPGHLEIPAPKSDVL